MSDPIASPPTPGTIAASIAAKISTSQSTGDIANRVVDVFAEREIARRVKLLTDGFDKLTTVSKAYDDINKPDIKQFADPNPSTPATGVYSEKRRGEIAKAKKAVDKLTEAITQALTSANYDALEKVVKGGGKDEAKGESED